MAYEYEDEEYGGGRVLLGRLAVLGVALLIVFFLGRCSVSPGGDEEELAEARQQLSELSQQNTMLREELEAQQAGGAQPTQEQEPEEGQGDQQAADQPEATETATPGGGGGDGETYEVQPDDTLFGIAQEVYGDGSQWELIADANNLTRDTPLQVGQVLEIPPES